MGNPTQGSKGNKIEFVKNSKNINNDESNPIITTTNNMEYANAAWMQANRPHESALTNHDPIITDTNLAEIDFEDFRNEDLAYAFSCGVSNSSLSPFLLIGMIVSVFLVVSHIYFCLYLRRKSPVRAQTCQYVVPRFSFPRCGTRWDLVCLGYITPE